MFSGIITEVGVVAAVDHHGIIIHAPKCAGGLDVGGSVAVNGTCLSAVDVDNGTFRLDVSTETAHRSTLGRVCTGDRVNLELPLRVGDVLGGHLVQGHVDAIGKVALVEDDSAGRRMWISPPKRFLADFVAKGPSPSTA